MPLVTCSSELFDFLLELRDTCEWLWLGEDSDDRCLSSTSWQEYDVCVTVSIGCTDAPTLPGTEKRKAARVGPEAGVNDGVDTPRGSEGLAGVSPRRPAAGGSDPR